MAQRKAASSKRKSKPNSSDPMIISKARTKAAVKNCNVGSEFYGALEDAVRELIARAEARALGNKRKTLRAADV